MIIEEPINNLPTPYFKINKTNEPQSKNPNLPPLFFSCLTVGPKDCGESYAMTSLLKMFGENPIYDSFIIKIRYCCYGCLIKCYIISCPY